jgi:hypothetical protein
MDNPYNTGLGQGMRNAELKKNRLIIFFTIIISLLIQGCGEEPAPPPLEQETPDYVGTIVAVGDSLTE